MSAQSTKHADPDAATAVEVLVESGAVDTLVEATAHLVSRALVKIRTWLAAELHTPDNSQSPRITFGEKGPWNGVVVVECDEPAFWALVKAGPGHTAQQINAPANPADSGYNNPRYGDPQGYGQHTERPWPGSNEFADDPFLQDPIWRRS